MKILKIGNPIILENDLYRIVINITWNKKITKLAAYINWKLVVESTGVSTKPSMGVMSSNPKPPKGITKVKMKTKIVYKKQTANSKMIDFNEPDIILG